MKYNKLIGAISLILFTACEMEINKPDFSAEIIPSASVKVIGDTIYALPNSRIEYAFSGNPDNIIYWSGEQGHQYANRNRTKINNTEKQFLSTNVGRHYGINAASATTYLNPEYQQYGLRLYYSQNMPDLTGSFLTDSTAIANATWIELTDEVVINGFKPKHIDPMTRDGLYFERGPYDLSGIKGNFKIGIQAKCNPQKPTPGGNGRTNTQTYYFQNFRIECFETETVNKIVSKSNNLGLTNIFLEKKAYESYYNSSPTLGAKAGIADTWKIFDPYWTVRNSPPTNTHNQYLSDFRSIGDALGSFNLGGGNYIDTGKPEFEESKAIREKGLDNWVISKNINFNDFDCSPDVSEVIKDIKDRLTTFYHIYAKPGFYKVTFVPSSVNIQQTLQGDIKEFNIKVVDVLP